MVFPEIQMNETCSKNLHQTVSRTWSTCTSNHTNAEAIVLIIDPVILAQSSYEEMAATSSPLESNQNSNSSHPAAVGTAASAENNADTSTAPRSTTSTLTVASLRRSNSHAHHSPTRVLRLTEQEERARTPPARNLSSLTLNHRPRSNPRTRTPRRAESPLDPNALRREDAASIPRQQQPRTITIRPHAGSAVGSLPTLRIREEEEHQRSAKQGPSHRKVRRWTNDHFDQLADELAQTSIKAARVLHEGRAHAHEYREIIALPNDKSGSLSKLLQDDKLASVRKEFMEGGGGVMGVPSHHKHNHRANSPTVADPEQMLRRIDPRLRRVVTKAATNSLPACRVLKTVETFLLEVFAANGNVNKLPTSLLATDWWKDVLLEAPTVVRQSTTNDDSDEVPARTNSHQPMTEAQFYFHATHPTGGFHRLLLHAVTQFHGLSAVSRVVHDWTSTDTSNNKNNASINSARTLTVRGRPVEGKFRLLDVLTRDDEAGDSLVVQELGASATWEVV